ncbi:hypothetical protein IFR05_015158 [Cadophora sp. M221]|nr:hypothetical protein IFR05_015158 [Cadophora sp. M221]
MPTCDCLSPTMRMEATMRMDYSLAWVASSGVPRTASPTINDDEDAADETGGDEVLDEETEGCRAGYGFGH